MAKHEEEEAHGNSERWLLTYSDMITLLLGLFIILYSMSTVNAKKVAEIAEKFGQALNGPSSGPVRGEGFALSDGGNGTGDGGGDSENSIGFSSSVEAIKKDALDEIYSAMNNYISQNNLGDKIELTNTSTYVKINLKDALMFKPDSANMLPESEPVLKNIQKVIASVYDKVNTVTISGHTADVSAEDENAGRLSSGYNETSWRLSTERAVTVLNYLVSSGLPPQKLLVEGHAHYSPVASNKTALGKSKNRRVEIIITKDPTVGETPAN